MEPQAEAVPVYDCTVPTAGAFDAGGLYVHNCSEYMFLDDTACFAPETRISTPYGLRTVEDLYAAQETGERIMVTTDVYGEHDHRRLTAYRHAFVTKVGTRQVFRMTLKDGRVIRTTGDHKFLTADGAWKRLDALEVGRDRVAIRESGDAVSFSSDPLEVKRWQMLGWLTGDGVFSKDTVALVFGPTERSTADAMTAQLHSFKTIAAGLGSQTFPPSAARVARVDPGQRRHADDDLAVVAGRAARIANYGFKQALATAKDVRPARSTASPTT